MKQKLQVLKNQTITPLSQLAIPTQGKKQKKARSKLEARQQASDNKVKTANIMHLPQIADSKTSTQKLLPRHEMIAISGRKLSRLPAASDAD